MTMKLKHVLIWVALLLLTPAWASLSVKVDEPKLTGSKAVIKLTMISTFTNKIESARAVAFLLDDKGKAVGQSAQWVIGGSKDRPALEPNKETPYFFVVPLDNSPPTSGTNSLKAKVTFLRVILEGGKQIDAAKEVSVTQVKN